MKQTLILLALLFCHNLSAETIVLKTTQTSIQANDGLDKLKMSLKYPESLLKRFEPAGATISNKIVSNDQVSFVGTKSWMGMSRSVYLRGTLDSIENNKKCKKNETGFDVTFNFDGSDSLIADNFEMIEIKLCVLEKATNNLLVSISPRLIQGERYSGLKGGYIQGLIEAQISPIIKALNQEITSK